MPSTALLPALRPLLLAAAVAGALPAQAGIDPFIGELMLFGGDYCPSNWLPAQGQELPISSYQLLYTLIGTTYGGDGMSTFALPASTQPATHAAPAPNRVLGVAQNAGVYASAGATVALAPTGVAGSPAPAPFSIRDPYLTMQWCIAVDGAFPSRN